MGFSPVGKKIEITNHSQFINNVESVNFQKVTTITGSDVTKNISMDGGILQITGSDNDITVDGFVTKVIVIGSDNFVNIEILNSAKITGSDNQITYRSSKNKSKKATVSSLGSDNSLIKK